MIVVAEKVKINDMINRVMARKKIVKIIQIIADLFYVFSYFSYNLFK